MKSEVKEDFDKLNKDDDNKKKLNEENKVDTSDYKRVNTDSHTTTRNTDNRRDVRTRNTHVEEEKPFYANWWFWLIVLLILWALWYFGFRN